MMRPWLLVFLLLAVATSPACKSKFGFKGAQTASQNSGGGGGDDDASPMNEKTSPSPFAGMAQLPTARIEVLQDGVLTSVVKAGIKVQVRPSDDTLDADDKGKNPCPNPGIVEVRYAFPNGETKLVSRKNDQDCSSLETEQTFQTLGSFPISMTVTSNEGEESQSTMTLKVVGESDSSTDTQDSLMINAKPLIAAVGEKITATANCVLSVPHVVQWDFGNGQKGTGDTQEIIYTVAGSFHVVAECLPSSGDKDSSTPLSASVTVVIYGPNSPDIKNDETGAKGSATPTPSTSATATPTTPPGGNDDGGGGGGGGNQQQNPGQR